MASYRRRRYSKRFRKLRIYRPPSGAYHSLAFGTGESTNAIGTDGGTGYIAFNTFNSVGALDEIYNSIQFLSISVTFYPNSVSNASAPYSPIQMCFYPQDLTTTSNPIAAPTVYDAAMTAPICLMANLNQGPVTRSCAWPYKWTRSLSALTSANPYVVLYTRYQSGADASVVLGTWMMRINVRCSGQRSL